MQHAGYRKFIQPSPTYSNFFQIVIAGLLAVASAGHLGYYGAPWAHHGYHIPVLDAHGFQLDTPEVSAAKAAHFAAHADARARTGHGHGVYAHAVAPVAYGGHYAGHYGYHIPAFDAHGYQLDTPEVAHAKAAHFAAHAKAAHGHYRKKRGAYYGGYHGPQHIPVIDAHGFQVDTPEVAHAKAAHFAAYNEAAARNHGHGYGHAIAPVGYAHGVAPLAYGHGHHYGAYHIPVIGPHGVPLDTPEVAHAKAAHFAAHAEAAARSHGHHY